MQLSSADFEGWHHIDLVPLCTQPVGVAPPLAPEREIEADHPTAHIDDAREQVDAFVAEQESTFEARDAELGITAEQRREDYELLQIYDRMSLLFCTNQTLSPPAAEFSGYRFAPDGSGVIHMSPFPFDGNEQRFSLVRRLLRKRHWPAGETFRRELFATEPQRTSIAVRAPDAE